MSSRVRERQQGRSGAETPVNRKYIRPCRYCGADFRTSRKDCYYCPTHRTNEARNEVMFRKHAQLSFLPESPPFSDPGTSLDAAVSMKGAVGSLRLDVLTFIGNRNSGATCDEIVVATDLEGNTVRPRLWELEKYRMIERLGPERETRAGRQAKVYTITALGERQLRLARSHA